MKWLILALCLVAMVLHEADAQACPRCSTNCPTGDCINHSRSQTRCDEVQNLPPSGEQRWKTRGLAVHTDQVVKKGEIIAYKIRWFNGAWSNWFVTGVNDIDCKYNVGLCGESLRRMWSYFIDHTHTYIICYNGLMTPP